MFVVISKSPKALYFRSSGKERESVKKIEDEEQRGLCDPHKFEPNILNKNSTFATSQIFIHS